MSTLPITPSKDNYKVRNWKEYNSNLCKRGSLSLWLDDSILEEWEEASKKGKIVGESTYSDNIIQCCLLIKISYSQKLRQSIGFISSLFLLLGKGHLQIPDYSTLCRRQGCLPAVIQKRLQRGENLHVGIDSTGLKVYGEGEWKVRKHGYSKYRTWRTLHVCIDLFSQQILSVELTRNDRNDAKVGKQMLEGNTGRISSFYGDGVYDDFSFRKILGSEIAQIIPPPKHAAMQKGKSKKPVPDHLKQRDEALEYINKHGSKSWKEHSGYHRRSLNEVAMFRYKTIFGGRLEARKMQNQVTEVNLKCLILNKFTGIGMPDSYKVA